MISTNCYIATEDKNFLATITKILEKIIPNVRIIYFDHGVDINNALSKELYPSLVICDFNLDGLNGLQILKKLKNEYKINDSYFILVVPPDDKETQIKAIQSGVDNFIYLPFTYEQLILKLKSASNFLDKINQISNLQNEIVQLADYQNLKLDLIANLLKKFYEYRINPNPTIRENVLKISEFIAKNLINDERELHTIISAADISFLPQLLLPDKYYGMPVYSDGRVRFEIFEKIPRYLNDIFSEVPSISKAINIITHINENYDGSGFPDKLKGPEIPLGSRILRVVLDFEYLLTKNNGKVSKSFETLWNSMNKIYDFRIIAFLDQYFAVQNSKFSNNALPLELKVSPFELQENLIISRDIIVLSGHKLVVAGTILNPDIIEIITNAYNTESILGNIFVFNMNNPKNIKK